MQLETISTDFTPVLPANSTASSAPALVPTVTAPVTSTTAGIISVGGNAPTGGIGSNGIILVPYGVGTSTDTFTMYVYGWRKVYGPVSTGGGPFLWVPMLLCTFTACTLDSNLPGVVNSDLGTTQCFCNTMTLGVGNSAISVEVVAAGSGDYICHTLLDCKGSRFIGVYFNCGTGVTSANALWAKI